MLSKTDKSRPTHYRHCRLYRCPDSSRQSATKELVHAQFSSVIVASKVTPVAEGVPGEGPVGDAPAAEVTDPPAVGGDGTVGEEEERLDGVAAVGEEEEEEERL